MWPLFPWKTKIELLNLIFLLSGHIPVDTLNLFKLQYAVGIFCHKKPNNCIFCFFLVSPRFWNVIVNVNVNCYRKCKWNSNKETTPNALNYRPYWRSISVIICLRFIIERNMCVWIWPLCYLEHTSLPPLHRKARSLSCLWQPALNLCHKRRQR